MIEVLDRLYLGDRQSACDRKGLMDQGITHIVNCALEIPCYYCQEFRYLALQLEDPDPEFHSCLGQAFTFIDEARQTGKVLVHCQACVSRSPALTLAYLCHLGQPLAEAARHLGQVLPTNPDPVFLLQLVEYLDLDWPPEYIEKLALTLMGQPQEILEQSPAGADSGMDAPC
jgi:hypothetical protein